MTQFVHLRFPDRRSEIDALYLASLDFRSLCHDYGVCAKEIDRLIASSETVSESKNQRLEQFRELQFDLEIEIIELLDATLEKHMD